MVSQRRSSKKPPAARPLGAPEEARGGVELLAAKGAALVHAAHAHVAERVPARVDEHVDLARVADAAVEAVLVLGGLALRLRELGARLLELVAQLQG